MHSRRAVAVVSLLCAALGTWAIITRPAAPLTTPDTAAYLEASPLVPLAYPLLLETIGMNGVALAQPIIFAAALAALGFELLAITGNLWITVAILGAIVMVPDVMTYHRSILTESLFISGLLAFVAATTRFARAPSWQAILAAAVVAGATASVRRTAYAFAPVVLLLIVLCWRTRRVALVPALAAGILPLAVCYAADHLAAVMRHGDALTSLTARHLFAKAALIEAPEFRPEHGGGAAARLGRELETTYAPIRALIAAAPPEIRASLVLYYETCLQWPCVAALRESIPLPEARKNELFDRVARERIAAAPGQFAWLTATHYGSLWTAYKLRHPARAPQLNTFLAAHRPLPFEREVFKVGPTEGIAFQSSSFVAWVQPLIIAIGIVTAFTAVIGVTWAFARTAPPLLVAASLAALTAHGSLLLTALGAAGISRFMVAIFPAIVVSTGLVSGWVMHKALGRASPPRYD